MSRALLAVAALFSMLTAAAAQAQPFFKDKVITIINSTGNGGSYYNVAQAFARAMPKYIPGRPDIIVKSMPGGGNVLATNFMYNIAAKDGTFIATINNSIPLHQVLDGRGVRFDARRFNWLGSIGTYNSVAYVWHTAGVTSIRQVMAREVVLGGTGVGSSVVIYPTLTNALLGTRFKIVLGYNTTMEMDIAMERGEIQSRTGSYTGLVSDHPDWIKDKKVAILFQVGAKRERTLPEVPLMTELASTDEQRQILTLISSPIALGRPFLAPPDVPPERLAILRTAFDAAMADKDFLDEMARMGHDVDPVSGEELARIVRETIATPPDILAKAKAAVGPQE